MSLISHIKEAKAEMKYVKWPTKNQVISYTVAVIIISLIIAIYLGALDLMFSKILDWFIAKTI